MRCVSDLAKLRGDVEDRLERLAALTDHLNAPLSSQDRRSISYSIIELDNLVVNGLRNLTKSSLMGGRAVNGLRVTSSVNPRSSEEAGALIMSVLRSAQFTDLGSPRVVNEDQEPTFRLTTDAERVLASFEASNLADVQLGSGLNGRVFKEPKTFRHFFAHRCRGTNEKVRAFGQSAGLFSFEDAEHLAISRRPSTGIPLLRGWYDDLHDFCALAF